MKLVFFGGCFDPPHRGHVEIIRQCLNLCDKFILMPTLSSPLKIVDSPTEPFHIMQMLNLIIQGIDRSIEIDEYDQNKRQVFNYGHSFGHAIESLTDYAVPHGIAVSFGMDMANFISVKRKLLDNSIRMDIRKLLQKINNSIKGYNNKNSFMPKSIACCRGVPSGRTNSTRIM